MNKIMRAGYQGKPDAMRKLADKLTNHAASASEPAPEEYKKGGAAGVKSNKAQKMESVKGCQKFALGGVAKIRHGAATKQGLPKDFKKNSTKEFL